MADIDVVLERLVTDAAFRGQLGSDPAAALAGYDLTADDLQLLASSLDDGDPGQRGVEQRTSKSAVLGLLASLSGGGGESEIRIPGKPKSGEIVVTRAAGENGGGADLGNAAPGGGTEAAYTKFDHIKGESADAPDDDEVARGVSGQKKYTNITLKRGADTSAEPGERFAPADPDGDPDLAFKQGWPSKWQGANAAPGDGDAAAAPGGETEAAYTKFDHIKGESADAPDDDEVARGVSGQKKYTNITLKRGADTSAEPGERFAPADPDGDPDLAFKQGWPSKWQGANAAPGDGDAPEAAGAGEGEDAAAWPKKIEYGSLKAGDTSAAGSTRGVPGADEGDATQGGDFLTIEDP